MKILDGMVTEPIGDKVMAVPTEEAVQAFSGIVQMNKTGHEIWRGIEAGWTVEEIARGLAEKYDGITYEKALEITAPLVKKLKEKGIVIDG